MKIAILRTEQADNDRAYNSVEFAAANDGVRAVAYVAARACGSFRGLPIVTPAALAGLGVEMVVAASPLSANDRQLFALAGWPQDRLLSYVTDRAACRGIWTAHGGWLAARRPIVSDDALLPSLQYARIGEPAVGDVHSERDGDALTAITARVFKAYQLAMVDAPSSGPYATGRNWGAFLRHSRPNFYAAAARGDVDALNALLESCLRNEMTTGTFGGGFAYEAYNAWVSAGQSVLAPIRQQYNVWRYSVQNADVTRLAAPAVGNPFGVWVGDGIVHPNTFLNDYRAQFVSGLVEQIDRPIVVDLGGGFGGFGHQLLANGAGETYVGFDLPENLIVAAYFLLVAHPEKRVLLYESLDQRLDPQTLRQYDIVLMPNFMLPRIADLCVDVFTNFISLSEMDYGSIVEYLEQVDRVCGGFFYHENLLDNGENYEFYPVSVFPALEHFKTVSTTPSRWPFFSPTSPHHCHGEILSVRRGVNTSRYLGIPSGADGRRRSAA